MMGLTGETGGWFKLDQMKEKQQAAQPLLRPIREWDTEAVADIIRRVMTEFEAVGCGYSITDTEVDDMFSAYASQGSAFYVVEVDGQVLGCGGYAPLTGGDEDTCELRKMYFLPELRGTGMGSVMLTLCLQEARRYGYRRCYIETLENMTGARRLYEKHGFKYLDKPMGNTGHIGCGIWMARLIV